jgi:sporulation protein YlmC with PRC-barrel domain
MKLSKDAKVYAQDGQEIGNLNRFVLDPQSKQVTHIVIGRGLLSKDEYLVPVDMIASVDIQGIHLRDLPMDKAGDLAKFEEQKYIVTDEEGLLNEGYVSDEMVRRYYYYPPATAGATGLLRPNEMFIYQPGGETSQTTPGSIPVSGEGGLVRRETEENIPNGTVALKEGAKVVSSEGKPVGSVEKVLVDNSSQNATHMVITKGLLTKTRRLVPMDWVKNISESEVTLAMAEALINQLPDYKDK